MANTNASSSNTVTNYFKKFRQACKSLIDGIPPSYIRTARLASATPNDQFLKVNE